MPIRYAERIRSLEQVPGALERRESRNTSWLIDFAKFAHVSRESTPWTPRQVPHWEQVPHLVEVHQVHGESFQAFRGADVQSFAQVAHEAGKWDGRVRADGCKLSVPPLCPVRLK